MSHFRIVILAIATAAALSSADAGERSSQQESEFTVRVGVDLVNVLFTVTDRDGRLVPGLGPDDFRIEEEGRRQEILHFSRENELPVTIGLLIDTSPSVTHVFEQEQITAARFLEMVLRPGDLAMVIGFDRTVTLFQDYTENTRLLGEAISSLEIGGGTSLYDAVYLASEEKLRAEAGRKAIILVSDGGDTTSKIESTEALIAAHQSDAVIYCISHRTGGFLNRGAGGDPGTLKEFSEETGGTHFSVNSTNDLEEVFDQIAEELRSQYSLGYVSDNAVRDGNFREIRITPRNRNYEVKARKGYYAPRDPATP